MEISTSKTIYNELRKKYKDMLEDAIKNYNYIYNEYLILIAELEAGVYIKICSVNEDSYGEIEGKRLLGELKKAEEDLKNIIDVYERIDENKNKIISSLNPLLQEKDKRMKSIFNGIKIEEFTLI